MIQIQELLDSINKTYSNCSYYLDKGLITEFDFGEISSSMVFETEFKQPDSLTIKTYEPGVVDEEDMTIETVSGGMVKTKFSKSRLERMESMKSNFKGPYPWLAKKICEFEQQCVAEVSKTRPLDDVTIFDTGYITSKVYYHWFPKLRRPWTKDHCALLSDKEVNGLSCYHIRCIDDPVQVWVSKNDFLIRRVEVDPVGCLSYWHKTLCQNLSEVSLTLYRDILNKRAPESENMLKKTIENPEQIRIGEFEEIEIEF